MMTSIPDEKVLAHYKLRRPGKALETLARWVAKANLLPSYILPDPRLQVLR